jgi:hypothetical protein
MERLEQNNDREMQIIYAASSESIESWPLDSVQGSIEPTRESVPSH